MNTKIRINKFGDKETTLFCWIPTEYKKKINEIRNTKKLHEREVIVNALDQYFERADGRI
jgi:hypothetical protein